MKSEIKLLSIYTNITPGWVLVGDLPLQKSEIREWRRAWNVLFWALFAWGCTENGTGGVVKSQYKGGNLMDAKRQMDAKKQAEWDAVGRVLEQIAKNGVVTEHCPNCGKLLRYVGRGTSYEVSCPTPGCLYEGFRGI